MTIGDIHGPKPFKSIRFGDIHGPKPYKFTGFRLPAIVDFCGLGGPGGPKNHPRRGCPFKTVCSPEAVAREPVFLLGCADVP